MENIHFTGLSIAISTFLVIGLFHPIVIKVEYYFGVRLWWIFLLAGIAFIVGSMLTANVIASSILGVLGASCLWLMSWCRPCWAWWVPRACGASASCSSRSNA